MGAAKTTSKMMKYVLFTIAITLVSANVMAEMQDDDSAWAWNTEQDKDIQSQLVADVEDASRTTGSLTGSLANTGSLTGSLTGEHAAEVENQMQDDDSAWAWNTEQDKDIQSQLVADVEDASRTTGSLTGSLA